MVSDMWALIKNGAVAEITEIDPTGRFHPSLNWEPCGADVRVGWVWDGSSFSEPPAPEPRSVEELHADIDRAAGDARERFVSPGYLVDQEYKRAEEAARSFAAAGYPESDVPSAVSSWASAKSWTAQQAADDIIATADYWYGAIDQIREIRLAGKAAVQAATSEQREATAQQYIDQLNALAVT